MVGLYNDLKVKLDELIIKLKEPPNKEIKIVCMPHFCIDNYVNYGGDYESFLQKFEKIAKQGGGNLALRQTLNIGGKAANCACALSSLGLQTHLIGKTDELGFILLEHFVHGKDLDISHVSSDGDLAFTTAIELEKASVMISDPGSLSRFGPEYLTEDDEKLILDADIVCVSDWGLNEIGTELARYIFSLIKENKKGKTFFDPGDPSPKMDKEKVEIEDLTNEVIESSLVDIMSVNEDEIEKYGSNDFLKKKARVDLHTHSYARSFYKEKKTEEIPTFIIKPIRLTGAGDAWNAGDIYGEVMGFPDDLRLLLANALATCYISNPKGIHPTRGDIINFLENEMI